LWPFAALGWPASVKTAAGKPESTGDLKEFYPTQVLSTDRGIINLWVTRMIFSGLEIMNEKPFSDIIIHPTVMAKDGRRMSKSLGTGIDPLVLIDKYGADATRFGLIYQMMGGQDIKFDESHLLAGKKFANKLWNISRFVITRNGISKKIQTSNLSKEDKEIYEKLEQVVKSVTENVDNYNFGRALHIIYDFVWHDFADKYIEYSKTKNSEERGNVLSSILASALKLLHPFMPFITEEIWSMISADSSGNKMLIIEKWPKI